jgi:DNA-directed RNA polymerase specialized sigma24 family protein
LTNREQEFGEVAMPQARNLLRFARRLTSDPTVAEDLVQETLMRAWRGFDQFRGGTNAARGAKGGSPWCRWAIRIAQDLPAITSHLRLPMRWLNSLWISALF